MSRPSDTSLEAWRGLTLQGGVQREFDWGGIAIVRSFSELSERIERLRLKYDVAIVGEVQYGPHAYPMYRIIAEKGLSRDKAAVVGGGVVHGDEPIGTSAWLQFLERHAPSYMSRYRFVVYPCINPSGYEANTLESMGGLNLNRVWGTKAPPPEIELIQADLLQLGERFLFGMDMHETPPYYIGEGFGQADNPRAPWLYETCADPEHAVGAGIIATLPSDIDVCEWPEIYQDANHGGVIHFSRETAKHAAYQQPTNFDAYLQAAGYSRHTFTTETPTAQPFSERLRFHLHCLRSALDLCALKR